MGMILGIIIGISVVLLMLFYFITYFAYCMATQYDDKSFWKYIKWMVGRG